MKNIFIFGEMGYSDLARQADSAGNRRASRQTAEARNGRKSRSWRAIAAAFQIIRPKTAQAATRRMAEQLAFSGRYP